MALALFWHSLRCQTYLQKQMDRVRPLRRGLLEFLEPEDLFLNVWFPLAPRPPASGTPLTEAEKKAELNAAREKVRAALEEEGVVPSQKNAPPPP